MRIYTIVMSFLFLSVISNALQAQFRIYIHSVANIDDGLEIKKSTNINIKKSYKNGEVIWEETINMDPDDVESVAITSKAVNISLQCSISTKSKEKATKVKLHLKEIRTSNLPEISVNQASRYIKKLREASFQDPVYIEGAGTPWEVWSCFHFPKEGILKIQPLNYISCIEGYFFANYEIYYKNKTREIFCLRLPETVENLRHIVN